MIYGNWPAYMSEAMAMFLLWVFSLGLVLLFACTLIGLVEEWCYGKRKPAQDNPANPVAPDPVGSNVVRPRARHRSIFPRVK